MRRYALRSACIMLGSIVGVAALTLAIALGQGAERKLMATIRQLFGASTIMLAGGGSMHIGGPRGGTTRLTIADVEALAQELPAIIEWDPQQVLSEASVRRGDVNLAARVTGQSERAPRVWERGASRGDYFDAAAVAGSARVAVIGETVARRLFGRDDPIGAEILIGPVSFRVIGILDRWGTDIHGIDRDNEIVVPISTMMRRVMNVDSIASARLLLADPEQGEPTAREIERILRARHGLLPGQPDDFRMMTPLEVQEMTRWAQRTLDLYVPLAAGLILLVGTLVAASLMLASVSERVSEIGLRRAVGARARDIQVQFLVEAAVITLIGGLGGIALGVFAAQGAAIHLRLDNAMSWRALFVGIAASLVTGLLAGVLPARRAARLQPADALR